MSSNLEGAFWPNGPSQDDFSHPEHAKIAGLKHGMAKRRAQASNCTFQRALRDKQIHYNNLNARKAFRLLKQDEQNTVIPRPQKCTCDAPEGINVYTDGSWLHPLKQFLGLGGAGVWWPDRHIVRKNENQRGHPISTAEEEMAHIQQGENGVSLYTKIGGFGGRSTRTELAAGLIAISAHGPVHIGSDSRAFVDTANNILKDLTQNKNRIRCKPWKLVSGEDLWSTSTLLPKPRDPVQ